jgi:hypothetical protein
MAVSGSTYQAAQTFKLQGSIGYVVSGSTKAQPIDVTLTYSNFQTSAPTATGQMGPVPMTSTPLPAPTPGTSSRCSPPREGCGPLVSGNAPCTKYPLCPT